MMKSTTPADQTSAAAPEYPEVSRFRERGVAAPEYPEVGRFRERGAHPRGAVDNGPIAISGAM
eukprot:CAMPEP_0117849004 /NCGR_PEP_ID=MMETSP0949-20121206/20818_1 /TAXON_ID=44440 /ORGANISM="Chattonella subsalsa, Strain CCMP2191" /LENGTH=62 /DNA_ID=CAMNT_0005696093 /DNA_START=132 /DNA_END=320 /DNA_ORIENTATION=-